MKKHIPNIITCLNLFCGCMSIVSTFNGMLSAAAYFILLAAVFDFFDGFAARWLKVSSEIGKQLDSLADMVSFGVAPASIMYWLLWNAGNKYNVQLPVEVEQFNYYGDLIAPAAFLIAVFSALRLAKFNIDSRQSDSFIGLPTPANAIFICSLAFISLDYALPFIDNIFFLLSVTVVFSFLLVANLPLFSLKFKSFGWKGNKIRYIFVVISVLILLILHFAGLAVVILVYIILSVVTNVNIFRQKSG